MNSGKYHSLVLDDDLSIVRMIERITEIPAIGVQSIDALLPALGNMNPIAAFIDIHLGASQSGLEAIPILRTKWPHIPVIVLTGDVSDGIIETALATGADDFIRKPIQPIELKARLNARLEEKASLVAKQIIRFGNVTVNCAHQRISADGKTAYLSPTALNLLCTLMELKGTTVSRDVLKRKVWGRLTLTDNALDRKVYEVRKALEEITSTIEIQNVYGEGYQIKVPGAANKAGAKSEILVKPYPISQRVTQAAAIRVLLVEDSDADAVIVREALRKRDGSVTFELKRVKTLKEGISFSEKNGFDIALLDLSLPDSQGLDTFKRMAEYFPELPMIILSGMTDDKLALEAVSLGAQDFLSKDEIRPVTLSKTIQYALSRFRIGVLEKSILKEKQTQLETLSELKSQFLANMSHEIRTPMNAVIGMTSILAQSTLTNEQEECVNTIRSSGQELLHIINEILDFSKFQSGKLMLENIELELRPLVENTIDLFSVEADLKGVALLESIDSKVPIRIKGDSTRLRQVLVNLVGNALKFTAKGSVTVIVTLSKLEENTSLRFEITDTGIGIKEEEKSRLFEVFSQANLSTTKKFGGTGLGLAISKAIVDLMKGQIGFESIEGEGTTFFFEIPINIEKKEIYTARPELSHFTATLFSERDDQGAFLAQQIETRGLKTNLLLEESGLLEHLRNGRDNTNGFTVIATHSEPKAQALYQKIESMNVGTEIKNRILWLIPKKAVSPVWNTLQVLKLPYTQSRLYEKIEQLLCGHKSSHSFLSPQVKKEMLSKISLPLPILVAEDNQVNQRVIRRLLEALGVQCEVVSNGMEAIERVKTKKHAAILMDCSMPEVDGYSATKKIRQMGFSIPIIAMTANAFKEDRDRCLNSGMDEYLSKPVSIEDLHMTLTRMFKDTISSSEDIEVMDKKDLQILNQEAFAAMNSIGKSSAEDEIFMEELKSLFREHAPATFENLVGLLDGSERNRISSQAHRLKGLAHNLCAEKLAAVCAQIEEYASHSQLEEARAMKPSLVLEWQNLMAFFEDDLAA